jgi:hypothetical protein
METNKMNYQPFLVILLGVEQWISARVKQDYRVPELTRWALHHLHMHQIQRGEAPTVTYDATLHYLSQPLSDIFDTNKDVPADVESSQLIDAGWGDGFELGDGVDDYLRSSGIGTFQTFQDLHNWYENTSVSHFISHLNQAYRTVGKTDVERQRIEETYTAHRRFLADPAHNVVSPVDDGLMFDTTWQQLRDAYYDRAHRLHHRVVTTDENGREVYLISPACGLLYKNSAGEFAPVTYSPLFEGIAHARYKPVTNEDFILKYTHHRRILIPGVPELWLFEDLQEHPSVQSLRLYPGIDRYDIRVEWTNGDVHALDIKTYRRATSFIRLLNRRKSPAPRIETEEESLLGFDHFWFLIPEDYVQTRGYPQGLSRLQKLAIRHEGVSIDTIENYLKEMIDV